MSFFEVLMDILAIIGIIAVGGLLIFILGDFMISILDNKNKAQNIPSKSKNKNVEQTFSSAYEEEKAQTTEKEQKFVVDNEEVKAVDFSKAIEEESSTSTVDEPLEKFSSAEPELLPVVEEQPVKSEVDINEMLNDDDFDFGDDFDFDNIFDEEKKEELAVAEENATSKSEVREIAEEQYLNNQLEQLTTQTVSDEQVVEKTTTEIVTTAEEQVEEAFNGNSQIEAQLKEEIASLKLELQEQKAEYERFVKQSKETEEKLIEEKTSLQAIYVEPEEQTKPNLSLAEYEARLVVLQERLKENEKDLKQIKKEFIPLKKVRKNLDKDIKKLRRREALVAKQKVVLYGVNNIADIDPEKAKKLAEDLDLLDGLKVSVRHCEEVMEENKDRYPILETSYRIISTTNKEIKEDIAQCEEAIRKLKTTSSTDADSQKLEYVAVAKTAQTAEAENLIANEQTSSYIESEQEVANPEILVGNASDIINNVNEIGAKKGRGRPKKERTPEELAELAKPKEKKSRGRPKKERTPEELAELAKPKEKRGRGRPRKEEKRVVITTYTEKTVSNVVENSSNDFSDLIEDKFEPVEVKTPVQEEPVLIGKNANSNEFASLDSTDFDDLEPSLEELLAIEQEEKNKKADDSDLF